MTKAELDALELLEKAATPSPWEFRHGHDRDGDSCDLLMAEVGKATPDEDPEYSQVFFHGDFSDAEISANWALAKALRNAAPRLIADHRRLVELLALAAESLDCHRCVGCKDGCAKEEAAKYLRQWEGNT